MAYYINKTIMTSFEQAIELVTEALKKEGFGVLTEIDVHKTFKAKLDVDFRRYKIMGACNPASAYKALQADNRIGTMLPCNVVVQELSPDTIEVAAVDPLASMLAVENKQIKVIAGEIKIKLKRVIASL